MILMISMSVRYSDSFLHISTAAIGKLLTVAGGLWVSAKDITVHDNCRRKKGWISISGEK